MNPYEIVNKFEEKVAKFSGCKFCVAVDNCTNAIFLCCKYLTVDTVSIPKFTYPSVPCSIIHSGGSVKFDNREWKEKSFYKLEPYPIYDAAHLFKRGMYREIDKGLSKSFICISFSATKPISIGKGGMIMTNDKKAYEWFKKARYCGRNPKPLMEEEKLEIIGWNMYMTPEQAARGMLLMNDVDFLKKTPMPEYPDLSKWGTYENTM